MENLIEELTKVNPSNLSEEGLKLFNKINEIIDRNEELEKVINKEYELGRAQAEYEVNKYWKSLIKEKIQELKNMRDTTIVAEAFNILHGEIHVLEELLNTKM